MKEIYVNLKRFEVPRKYGGLCPLGSPTEWIESVMKDSVESGLGSLDGLSLVYLLPEGLISAAVTKLNSYPDPDRKTIEIGCQGVHWDDIQPGGNFGAFTSSLPAASARNLGSTWAIVGHSEERRAKFQVMGAYDPDLGGQIESRSRASTAVDRLVQKEVDCALNAGLNVLLCVGESAEERGEGSFEEQQPRIEAILKSQLLTDLQGAGEHSGDRKVVVGYEPIWAIGPGKTPPDEAYISFVSAYIKGVIAENFGAEMSVVYGGGLKEENAAMITGIDTIDGGLVALTRFTGEIGFDVVGLKGIIELSK